MMLEQIILRQFTRIDYVLFVTVLVISFFIGLYHGFWSKNKPTTPEEYFLGNRNMGVIPVALSLLVTYISGMNIIGVTSDVYAYGTYHWLYAVSMFVMVIVTSHILLPVFYELRLPSSFSYLKLRFGRKIQLLGSLLFILQISLFSSINLYLPPLVLKQAAEVPIALTTIVLGFVCIFYTGIGGFRAVIWADIFQTLLIVGSCVGIVYTGVNLVGGFGEVWEAAERGGRLKLYK